MRSSRGCVAGNGAQQFQVLFEALEPRLMLDAASGLLEEPCVSTSAGACVEVPAADTDVVAKNTPLQATVNIPVNDLLPLMTGNTWTYSGTDSFGAMTRQVTVRGGSIVGADTVYEVQQSDTGLSGVVIDAFYLSTTSGLKLHRFDRIQDIAGGLIFPETETYLPLTLMPATVDVGNVIPFTGAFSGYSAVDFWTGNVSGDFTVVSRQMVTVPVGTFDALRIDMTAQRQRIDGALTETRTYTASYWFVENVGLVKETTTVQVAPTGEVPYFRTTNLALSAYAVQSSAAAEFATTLYTGILRRLPDSAGLAGWVSLLQGGLPQAAAVQSFLTSTEFERFVAPVTRLYRTFLGRSPDLGGLTSWVNVSRAVGNIGPAAWGIAHSAEFTALHGTVLTTTTNTDFVRFLYLTVLTRVPNEAPGTNEVWPWVQQLITGTPREALMAFFTDSAEHINATWNAVHAVNMGLGLLNRAPVDGPELAAWTGVLTGGGTLQNLAQMVLNSAEYAALHKSVAKDQTPATALELTDVPPPDVMLPDVSGLDTLIPAALSPTVAAAR